MLLARLAGRRLKLGRVELLNLKAILKQRLPTYSRKKGSVEDGVVERLI